MLPDNASHGAAAMSYPSRSFAPVVSWVLAIVLAFAAACGPGNASDAPAFVVVDPGALDFQAGEDSQTLLLQNTGDVATSVTLKVAAEANGVTWLEVEPDSMALDGGAAKAVTVRVVERTSLVPATYNGSLTVEALGLDSVTVPVTLAVGQPVLSLEPLDLLDYGAAKVSLPLVIKNTGAGHLVYAVKLPGAWMSTESVLQKEILSNEPQTLQLLVDRTIVPWYGEESATLLVTSNGLDDEGHSSTAAITVKVVVDASCEVDANCLRDGYFCDKTGGSGTCTLVKELGQVCAGPGNCASGFCQQGVCCDIVCVADCLSCSNEGTEGTCGPVADETACPDEDFCTVDEACKGGECLHGDRDCSGEDTLCSKGVCNEEDDVCLQGPTEAGWCYINGDCVEEDTENPDITCFECRPNALVDDWSLKGNACFIGGVCHVYEEALGPCKKCDAATPSQPSLLADGTLCDDQDFCTLADQCLDGECVGDANGCDDLKGQCIDAICSAIEQKCVPFELEDGLGCDDEDACTADDACSSGFCVGIVKDCSSLEEGNACRHAWCEPGSEPIPGECVVADVEDGTLCDDQAYCVVDEVCLSGECVGSPYQCPEKQCAAVKCDEALDSCTYAGDPEQVGDACDDSDVCVEDTVCTAAGLCGAGDPVTGDDCAAQLLNDNPCMGGFCDPVAGCYLKALQNGTECPLDNAQAQCLAGKCVLVKCGDGWGNCNKEVDDGCEHDLTADHQNCGQCNNVCPDVADATVGCVEGECAITKCVGHMADCDGQLESGCETDLWTDLDHCGECNGPCKKADFFANADVDCATGSCLFLGCNIGFKDANNNCVAGKNCVDGCESCQAVGDGLTEIPDDGRDTDCDGDETVNDEGRGYYVDGSHSYGGDCLQPGVGTRTCPFKHPQDAVDALTAQDWSDPYVVKREVYIAQGEYFGAAPVVSMVRPLFLVGGYLPTDEGPWERSDDRSLTTIEGDGGCVLEIKNNASLWAAVDGLTLLSKNICFSGFLFVKNVEMGGASATTASSLWLQESKSGAITGNSGASNWLVLQNELTSLHVKDLSSKNASVVGNTMSGSVILEGDSHTLLTNDITGTVTHLGHAHTYIGNSIGGSFTGTDTILSGSDDLVLTNNTIGSGINGKGGEGWKLTGNSVLFGGLAGLTSATLSGNYINGPINASYTSTFVNNTIIGGMGLMFRGVLTDNYIEGSLTFHDLPGTMYRNVILGNVDVAASSGQFIFKSNLVTGSVRVLNHAIVLHNTIFADNDRDYALMIKTGNDQGAHIAGNIFYWSGGTMETHHAIKESAGAADAVALYDNAFFGFGGDEGILFLDESTTPVTDVDVLNGKNFGCGSGGNLAFDSKLAGKFVSISPSAEGFMVPTVESPFVDKGPAGLPVNCGGQVVTAPTKDVTGQAMPCGVAPDMGCYELCQ